MKVFSHCYDVDTDTQQERSFFKSDHHKMCEYIHKCLLVYRNMSIQAVTPVTATDCGDRFCVYVGDDHILNVLFDSPYERAKATCVLYEMGIEPVQATEE